MESNPLLKKYWGRILFVPNDKPHNMHAVLNDVYDKTVYEEKLSAYWIHKLTLKLPYKPNTLINHLNKAE